MSIRKLQVYLVRPTKYDDDGYLLRHWRGVLPSNSLACLRGLTERVRERGALGDVALEVFAHDESVERLPERRIRRSARRDGVRPLLCLVGVQTSQMPRAIDLTRRFRAMGVRVLIGGFHVSGCAYGSDAPPEITQLLNAGATIVRGEVEEIWAEVLRDASADRLQPVYDTLLARPMLEGASLPQPDRRLMRRFVHSSFATMDSSRGCPFSCSFCTIIHVQGRQMRVRKPSDIGELVSAQHQDRGIDQYFFTDDDFARNPRWREVLGELIRLREQENAPIRFLMQADLLAHRQRDFVELARRAGCFQVFLGMESLDAEALRAAGKKQNRLSEYVETVRTWQEAGIFVHAGYIIGFPGDTPVSVRENVRRLRDEIGVDLVSFFLLTPLVGSADHSRARASGIVMDPDLNRHDTFHAVVTPERMSRAEAEAAYHGAWRDFYSFEHRRRRLAAWPEEQRATLLQNYLWYMAATRVEHFHPMMTGFVRIRPRRDRRDGSLPETRLRHIRRRAPEVVQMLGGYVRELRAAERLWREAGADEHPRGWRDFMASVFARGARETGALGSSR